MTPPGTPERGQGAPRRSTPLPLGNRLSHEDSRSFDDDPGELRWFTVAEAAQLCRRSPGTLDNLISRYQVRYRRAWVTRRGLRRRVRMLSPGVVRWLQGVTLFRRADWLEYPPR